MNDMNQLLLGLPDVNNIGLSATKCFDDGGNGLISICGWSQDLTPEADIALTIVDETDNLEWTCMIRSVFGIKPSAESFQVKIPRSSVSHRLVVTVQVLRKILVIDTVTSDFERRKITSEGSCEAMTGGRANALSSQFPVLDVRPQLREGVGVRDDAGGIIRFLDPGTMLPADRSLPLLFRCAGKNMGIDLYQGNSSAASQNRKLHSVALPDLSVGSETNCTLSLNVDDYGTLISLFAEVNSSNNFEKTISHCIVDVICPKIAINNRDPYELRVEWMRTFDKVVLTFTTSYVEIYCWRVSFAVAGAVTSHWGYVFLYLGDGNRQRFEVPSSTFEVGLSYKVTVEGLKLIDGRFDDSCGNFRTAYFRTVCRNSVLFNTLQLPVSQDDDELRIEIQRSTFQRVSVLIATNPQRANQKLKISIQKTERFYTPKQECFNWTTGSCQRFDFPMQLHPGHRYQVMVELSGDNSVRRAAIFRAELTTEDITNLYRSAVGSAAGYGSLPCLWLYRNKSQEYFDDILDNNRGIMEVYDKDNSGDPASPINLQIKGLFFMASVERGTSNGEPLRASPFGPLRICVPAEELLAMAPNIYFVDFYCMRGQNHQVTLVMTRPGSATDRFCAERLLPLYLKYPCSNPFFFYDTSGQLRVSTRDQLLVELLFTEDLDIRGYPTKEVRTVGKGSSTWGGIPKNVNCQMCNLQRCSAFPHF